MSRPKASRQSGTAGSRCSRPEERLPAKDSPQIPSTEAEALRQARYQHLTRRHLGSLLDGLFSEFTGLHFHTAWAPTASPDWDARSLPTGCSECCRLAETSLEAQPDCQVCGPKQLARALCANGDGLSFYCRLGVLNYWLPIYVRGVVVGITYLQSFDGVSPGSAPEQRPGTVDRVSGRSEFRRAGRLLRLMMQHVETLCLADLRQDDLTKAEHTVLALEKEQVRLHEALQRQAPAPPGTTQRVRTNSHSGQIVQHLLARINQDYGKPIVLQRLAGELGMNVAYLSNLFSHAVGQPFKAHLTEVRLKKARELLSDAGQKVSAVAFAVGYTNENRFRAAFKQATGLAPTAWRETLRLRALALAVWFLDELPLAASVNAAWLS